MNTTITQSGFTATINNKGAELISLKNTASNREYIWEGNPDFWGKHSPVLFPIVGTLKNNSYTFEGETYHLLRHGFARDREFQLVSQKENQAVFSLQSDAESLKVYPFHFELQLIYTLENKKLTIGYKIINKSNAIMPFSIGAHPAFALPKAFGDYTLAFEKTENLLSYQLENDLLSETKVPIAMNGNQLPLHYRLFEKDALIFKTMASKSIMILENDQPLLRFEFTDFPNFGIWTKVGAPFICLEPWIGYSDILNTSGNIIEKEAIQLLETNKTFECRFSIEIL